jgi:hypothetical protein
MVTQHRRDYIARYMLTFNDIVERKLSVYVDKELTPERIDVLVDEIVKLHKEYGGYMQHGTGAILPPDSFTRMPQPVPKPSSTKKVRGRKPAEPAED